MRGTLPHTLLFCSIAHLFAKKKCGVGRQVRPLRPTIKMASADALAIFSRIIIS
ncbi:hypothetical protein HMPREF9436_00065 [Faecalibacterium cf. prausnitzii KLE1255]|uniref:Uncharacterized protein n=1 Tax=Faecalibacterium cf. prausnitzii KLE1255 TaxID=748224 RepID=E2ZEJ0_9FIRM|nr:hypothetical protein HMPREF9436_00065 [Faecalibacterium cf. prausnitzii KLE1255]